MLIIHVRDRTSGGGKRIRSERSHRKVKEYAVDLADPETRYTIAEYESDDFYGNPGSLINGGGSVPTNSRFGGGGSEAQIIETSADGSAVFLYGNEYNEDPMVASPRNFIDRVEIRTGDKTRIFEAGNDGEHSRVVSILDADAASFVVSRESPTEIAQSHRVENGSMTQLTNNIDYTPQMTNAPRQRFTVERPDGFRFLVNVTLPPGYEEGTRLPAMFWFYPREYTDQESYDERGRTYNKDAFPNLVPDQCST